MTYRFIEDIQAHGLVWVSKNNPRFGQALSSGEIGGNEVLSAQRVYEERVVRDSWIDENLREDDMPYTRELVNYLQQRGFQVFLNGSARVRKDYRDIDLKAVGTTDQVATTFVTFIDPSFREDSFRRISADGSLYDISVVYDDNQEFTPIGGRLEIKVRKTTIDLSMRKT